MRKIFFIYIYMNTKSSINTQNKNQITVAQLAKEIVEAMNNGYDKLYGYFCEEHSTLDDYTVSYYNEITMYFNTTITASNQVTGDEFTIVGTVTVKEPLEYTEEYGDYSVIKRYNAKMFAADYIVNLGEHKFDADYIEEEDINRIIDLPAACANKLAQRSARPRIMIKAFNKR